MTAEAAPGSGGDNDLGPLVADDAGNATSGADAAGLGAAGIDAADAGADADAADAIGPAAAVRKAARSSATCLRYESI